MRWVLVAVLVMAGVSSVVAQPARSCRQLEASVGGLVRGEQERAAALAALDQALAELARSGWTNPAARAASEALVPMLIQQRDTIRAMTAALEDLQHGLRLCARQ